MTKHTPGPWHWSRDTMENRCDITLDSEDTGYSILYCCKKPREPNARLIAAAPDLLEALEAALRKIEWILPVEWDVMRQINAAIAKAKGEQL